MFAHVDEAKSLAGSVQRPLHHHLRGAHKGVDRSVGGSSGVDIQQAAAGGAADGCGNGIDHLGKREKVAEHRPHKRIFSEALLSLVGKEADFKACKFLAST